MLLIGPRARVSRRTIISTRLFKAVSFLTAFLFISEVCFAVPTKTIIVDKTTDSPAGVDASGNLQVNCVTGCSGGGGSGGTSALDNSAFTAGTTPMTPAGGFYHSTIDTVTDGRAAALAIDSKRNLFTVLRDAAGNARGMNINSSNQASVSVDNNPVLGAGTNVIGHTINDSGSTTVVTGNVAETVADGANTTLGAKADAKSTATDTTAITAMQVWKEISFMLQNPASVAVTNAGTFAVQAAITAAINSLADGAIVTMGAKADAKSTATDTTAVTIMQVLKEISAMEQAPASRAVTNAGTFAVQATEADGANTTLGAKADAKSTATDTTAITIMQVLKEISAMEQAPASRAVTNAGTFAVQAAITAASGSISSGALASGSIASGAIASGAVASGAVVSGAFASGSISDGAEVTLGAKADAKSTATDTTAITAMQVLKEISFMLQNPAALPANQSVNLAQVNGVTNNANPCTYIVPTTVAISQTAGTKLISQTSAKKNYICGGEIVVATAEIVNIVEGTGSTCGTATAAVVGSTTAANGLSLAANGGFIVSTPITGTGTNLDLCLTQNGSARVSGHITYVQV